MSKKEKKKNYSWTKNREEIKTVVFYLLANFEPINVTDLVTHLEKVGMEFARKSGARSGIGNALKALQQKSLVVCDRLVVPEPQWRVARETYKSSFRKKNTLEFIRPIVTAMQLSHNPETKDWIEYLELLQASGKAKKKKTNYITIKCKLKALHPILGTKNLPLEEQKIILKDLGQEYSENSPVSYFRRRGELLEIVPGRAIKKAIQACAPDKWGVNIGNSYEMLIRVKPIDLLKDRDKDFEGKHFVPDNYPGTYVIEYPVQRTDNHFDRNERVRSALKRIETAPPGFYVECFITIPEHRGVHSVLDPLSRGIFVGAQREQGQGLLRLVDFEILGYTNDHRVQNAMVEGVATDIETLLCLEKLATVERSSGDKASIVGWTFSPGGDQKSIDTVFTQLKETSEKSNPPSV